MVTLYSEDDLRNISLQCPHEKEPYPDPTVFFDSNNNHLYAYVTLVMLGDKYISAAIVLAHSLRKLRSKTDLVVLVTNDVTEEGRRILARFYDKIIEVNYIDIPNWRTKTQKHRKYLNLVFTKFNLFNLTQYKKVLLIDADAIVLKYPDHLFTLNAPAGCFLEDKDLFITYDKDGNYILPINGKIKWYDKYCKCCGHGKKIPKYLTDRVLTNSKNSGIGGGLILLEPKVGEFDDIIKDISSGKMKDLIENKFVWPEQQYLTARYSGEWTSINPRFFGLQGYPHWSVLYGVQYGGDKPFTLESKMDICQRTNYPDYILWHNYYEEILNDHPDLRNMKSLNECNKFHKHFIVEQRRHEINFEGIKQVIDKKYDIPFNQINDKHVQFYYLSDELVYRPVNLKKPMFENIKPYDYFEPIKKLRDYFGDAQSKYYEDLLNMYKIPNFTSGLEAYDIINPADRDEIMLQYVKCRPNTFVITIWPLAMNKFNEFIEFMKTNGNVYYTKIINISYDGLRNLMFWMYDEFTFGAKLEFIEKKLKYIEAKNKNKIGIIIFENSKNLRLSGKGSSFKKEIRNKIMDLTGNNKDMIHINDYFYQTVEYCQILLNENSLNLLENQDVRKFRNENMIKSHLKYQTFRNWLYNNITSLDRMKLCVIGGVVLYAYSMRPFNDIHGILINYGRSETNVELQEEIHVNFGEEKTKFPFADICIEGSAYWKSLWTEKNDKIINYFQITTFSDVVLNPRYHMYFQGIKLYLLDYEIVRKIQRNRAHDYADFIMMYFFHRELLGHFIYLENNKLQFDKSLHIKPIEMNKKFIDRIYEEIQKKYIPLESKQITKEIISDLLKS